MTLVTEEVQELEGVPTYEQRRAELIGLIRRAPKPVQREYIRCRSLIKTLLRIVKPGEKIENAVLYETDRRDPIRDAIANQVFYLLSVHRNNCWMVFLLGELGAPDLISIRFSFDPNDADASDPSL